MDKLKFLASVALVAMLLACGSDNGSPPELANKLSGTISPFDTLVVKFKSELIELDKLDESNIILNNGKFIKGKTTGKELRFVGTNATPGGSHYFDYGKNDSIIFKKLKNSDGYRIGDKDSLVFSFFAYTKLDNEVNNREEDANDIETLGELTKGITFVGVIDKEIGQNTEGFSSYDTDDYFKLNLKQGDIISITASNKNIPLKLHFYGPCNSENKTECNNKTDSTTAKKSSITLIDTIRTGHLQGNELLSKMIPFYINVTDKNIAEKSNPYMITVKLTYRKP